MGEIINKDSMMKIQIRMLMNYRSIFFVLLSEEISFVSVVLTYTETVSLLETEKEVILFTDSSMNV